VNYPSDWGESLGEISPRFQEQPPPGTAVVEPHGVTTTDDPPPESMGGVSASARPAAAPEILPSAPPTQPPLLVPDLHVELGFPSARRPARFAVDDAQSTPARK
jgi:hypothetical protein